MKIKDEAFFKAIQQFLDSYIIGQRNQSPNTKKSYKESLRLLLEFFKSEKHTPYEKMGFELITYANVADWLSWLEETRGCSVSTINQRLTAIRSFTKYVSIIDPAKIAMQMEISNISPKKGAAKIVEFLTAPVLGEFLRQPDLAKSNGERDHFFMALMYDAGARCQEVIDLKVGDLDLSEFSPTILLKGKGGKVRRVPVSGKIVPLVHSYLSAFHPATSRKIDDYLFYTVIHGSRHKVSVATVNAFFRKYGESCRKILPETPVRIHPHQLRHSRAMHLYRAGMPLVLLSEFLGHANVNTTRIYAYADAEMKRAAIKKIDGETGDDDVTPIWENNEEMIKRLYGLA